MGEGVGLTVKKPEVNRDNSDLRMRKTDHPRSVNPSVNRILFLQRTVGNQAVQRLMKSKALQAKLRIGQPGDKYEQEADRVADEVMRMREPGVQRQVEEEEEEEILQTKPLVDQITPLVQRQVEEEEEEEMLQAKSREDATSEVSYGLESQINAIKGGGRPLAESERAYFEPRFGADFGQVRVHTDARAADVARAVNARAFTTGRDVVFGAGEYSPGTIIGNHLLAHELTHVIQQRILIGNRARRGNSFIRPSHTVYPLLQLQRLIGNQAVQRSIQSCDEQTLAQEVEDTVNQVKDRADAIVKDPVENEDTDNEAEFLLGYTQCDFLDERISYEAQYALYHLYKHGGINRGDAVSMLGAVKNGQIQGIYKEDQGKPALMARRHETYWWHLIPQGQGAIVFEPQMPQMMVFKNNIANNRADLADALLSAWEGSSLDQQAIIIPPPSLQPCPISIVLPEDRIIVFPPDEILGKLPPLPPQPKPPPSTPTPSICDDPERDFEHCNKGCSDVSGEPSEGGMGCKLGCLAAFIIAKWWCD